MISNDVLEHVPDIKTAFDESHRTLKQGGTLMFSVPFTHAAKTERRAEMAGDELKLPKEAVYHGNPVSSGGSLVFYDFGWDIIDICKESGFSDVYMAAYFCKTRAHLSYGPLFMFVAEK